MANTVSVLSYANTFGDWVVNSNLLTNEINAIGYGNWHKPTGTLYLDNSTLALYVGTGGIQAYGNTQFLGTANATSINSNLSVGGQLYLSNTNNTIYSSGTISTTSLQVGSILITGPLTANQIASVAAANISGSIVSSQIQSVAAANITGLITSSQIQSVANTQITGSISAASASLANSLAGGSTYALPYQSSVGTTAYLSSGTANSVLITSGVSAPPAWSNVLNLSSLTLSTPLSVSSGGTGVSTLTTSYGVLAAGTTATGAIQNIGTGTSGQILTSNGPGVLPSFAAAPSSMTLLGTITPTAVNSISLGSLTLTSYKSLYIVVNNIGYSGVIQAIFISSSNVQSGGGFYPNSTSPVYGTLWLDLGTGVVGGNVFASSIAGGGNSNVGGLTNVTTSTTTIYFRVGATNNFLAAGTITIYGVK